MSQATLIPKPPVVSGSPEEFKNSRRESRRYGLFAPHLMKAALVRSFVMLRPDIQWKNPVMFVVEIGTVLSIVFTFFATTAAQLRYLIQLDIWLFATVVFANFATALAEARGKAQADSLRKTRRETPAFRLLKNGKTEETVSTSRRSTSLRSPANRPPSSGKPAATTLASPVGRASSPTGSSSKSPPVRGTRFSIA
jgi:hypothetical protein